MMFLENPSKIRFFKKIHLQRDTYSVSPSYVHIFFGRLKITSGRLLFNLWDRVFERYSQKQPKNQTCGELSPLLSSKSPNLENRYQYLFAVTGGR